MQIEILLVQVGDVLLILEPLIHQSLLLQSPSKFILLLVDLILAESIIHRILPAYLGQHPLTLAAISGQTERATRPSDLSNHSLVASHFRQLSQMNCLLTVRIR